MKKFVKIQYLLLLMISISSCSSISLFSKNEQNKGIPKGNVSYGDRVRLRLIENVPNYRFCLEKYLPPTESGTFNGSVTFSFAINRHGMVKEVAVVSDQLRNIKAKGCLIKTITMLEMPKHDKKKDFKVRQPMGISMQ